MGTTPTSKNPMVRFTQRTKYTAKLVVTNAYGSDSLTKVDYINIGAYDQPQCLSDINLADGSIGITRVKLEPGIDTSVNAYNPCFQIVGGNQAANLYRGKKHALSITRPSTTSPMDRKAWIDFNMDGVFTNDELVMNEMNATNLTKIDTVAVTPTQILGATRMRVGVSYAGTTLNPSVTFLGVFRDYLVNFPLDTVKPTINLNGNATYYTEIHKPYVDPGVNANDNIEGNISSRYQVFGTVDTSKVGPNYLKYIAKDYYGNVSDTMYRTVFVVLNQSGPSLGVLGASPVYVQVYNKYTEPGYTAKDNQGNNISNQVVITSNLDTSKIGLYSITYTVIDAFGLSATGQRAVNVGDTARPVITPKGSPYLHQVGTAIDLSKIVDVTDNYWARLFIDLTIQGTVDVNSVGSYYISYVARDNTGNLSDLLLLEVKVLDRKAPVIVLTGDNPMNTEVRQSFIDPGYTVSDNYWPAGTISVSIKNSPNINVLGEYTRWYIATDPSGNKDSVSRVIKVVDTTKPRVDLLNITEVNLPRWKVYTDAEIDQVSLIDNYNTDAQMRTPTNFIKLVSLPKNAQGQYFGDAPGLYSVRYTVKDLSGNVSDESVRTINVTPEGPAGLEIMNIDRLMSVYPNPSNGLINLRLAGALPENVKITVLDMLGKEITQMTINGNNLQTQELNLTAQPKGIYFLKVQTGDQVYTKKLQIN
jgi:PKD repeat protein